MIKSRLLIIMTLIISSFSFTYGQCNIKSTDQNDSHITYYLDPELVAQTSDMGIAFSVQLIEDNYYLAITYQFAKLAVPLEEKVAIELQNGYTLELEMYTMQVANASGVELTLAVFNLFPDQMDFFTKSKLKAVQFKTQTGKSHNLKVTSNYEVLIRQLKCFGK